MAYPGSGSYKLQSLAPDRKKTKTYNTTLGRIMDIGHNTRRNIKSLERFSWEQPIRQYVIVTIASVDTYFDHNISKCYLTYVNLHTINA